MAVTGASRRGRARSRAQGQGPHVVQPTATIRHGNSDERADALADSVRAASGLRRAAFGAREASRARNRWMKNYVAVLVAIDLVTGSLASAAAFLLRFHDGSNTGPNLVAATVLPIAWVCSIALNRGYEGRYVGAGSEEFRRTFHASLYLMVAVSIASFVTHADLARGFVLASLPLAAGTGLVGRYVARKSLHRYRAKGKAFTNVLLVGDVRSIDEFSELMRRDRHAGMRVVGACVPGELIHDPDTIAHLHDIDVPLLGDIDSILPSVATCGADTVAVVSSSLIGAEKLRWISWQLEGHPTDLVVAPGLAEVAGNRLHIQPVAGLPLLHVDEPEFTGFRRVLKAGLDRFVALSALIILAPLLVAVAIAVRLDSRGPALFRQTRIGLNGRPFTMVKFRSMFVDAEARLGQIKGQNDHGSDHVLFKMKDDPRVTRVGKLLRKTSLDELPQLFNVLGGSMSLVGPRPPLPSEVARYEEHVHRRLLVKPGLTGLWQVSGRSNLAWDESVRLDLRYVENWSIASDLMILWKTMFAIVRREGAY